MADVWILVVDDNDVNCLVADSMLKILGYSTVIAKSGAEALKSVMLRKFDLILMDWQMPEMNGFDTATAIWNGTSQNARTNMIAVTASAFKDDQAACLMHGFKAILTKPYDVDQLSDLVEKFLTRD
jgi:two-component system, sensor histidine kinase